MRHDLRTKQQALHTPVTAYSHDGFGRRIRKFDATGAASTVTFAYDQAGQLLGEYDSTGKVIREYVWLNNASYSIPSTPIAVFTPDPAVTGSNGLSAAGVPTAAASNSVPLVSYIHTDHLNTPRLITTNQANTAGAGQTPNNVRWS